MAEEEAEVIEIDMAELKKMKVGKMSLEDMPYGFTVSMRLPTLKRK